MTNKNVQLIKVGDVVLPPERELRLWMRRTIIEKNLPECALHLTVKEISTHTDKKGLWFKFKAQYPEIWGHTGNFTFRALSSKQWPVINT